MSSKCASERKFENWLMFGEDMDRDKVERFLGDTVWILIEVGSVHCSLLVLLSFSDICV